MDQEQHGAVTLLDCRDQIDEKTRQIESIARLIISGPDDMSIKDIRGAMESLVTANEGLQATCVLLAQAC